jgi:hypothetical protein
MAAGLVMLQRSDVRNNRAGQGGGVFNSGGTVALSASDVMDNHPDNCEPQGTIPGCVG